MQCGNICTGEMGKAGKQPRERERESEMLTNGPCNSSLFPAISEHLYYGTHPHTHPNPHPPRINPPVS